MRRLLMGFVCGAVAGYALWVLAVRLRERPRAEAFEAFASPPFPPAQPEPVAEVVYLAVPEPEPAAPPPVRDSELRLRGLAALRIEILETVDRRALYTMAHDRGLPHHALFLMSSSQLLDAVLAAEELPPADVLPSIDTERRVREIAAEALARHERVLAEDAGSELDAG
ncbi:MAG: hypothetical protein ACHQEA_01300 [Gaiellales bacterium]